MLHGRETLGSTCIDVRDQFSLQQLITNIVALHQNSVSRHTGYVEVLIDGNTDGKTRTDSGKLHA